MSVCCASIRDAGPVRYAISAVLGCNELDPRMYHHVGDALGLAPEQ
ncbi:hypothetical protein LRD69_24255 [Streptomyces sp. JH14]|nr:hypothetical protein [Streptomyces sp. JH14]MDF6045205.1 hypothetical protein [Streptomyces sp. JH14]